MAGGIVSIIWIILFLFTLGIFVFIVYVYNGLIQLKNNISKSWANIDVLLKQRSNELPNLVSCVKGYMKHERVTLELLTNARTNILRAKTLSQKAAADGVITDALKTIFAVAERYPDLKANETFLQLQERITGLENELADRREFYNDSVTIYNTRIQSFPDLFIARMFHNTDEELFKTTKEDKKNVELEI